MGKLINLLRWKKQVPLVTQTGEAIKNDKGKPESVWVRIIGDEDQQDAYRMARIKSYEKRMSLRDENSPAYKDEILPIKTTSKEIAIELIKAAKSSGFTTEALVSVERPEVPRMDELAIDPDGPSLEEQEKLDREILQVEEDYQKAIREYVETKSAELNVRLQTMELEELREEAMAETANSMALATFLAEIQDEKVWRSLYDDEACTIRAVNSIEEFRALHPVIKRQLIDAYNNLELSPDEIKN